MSEVNTVITELAESLSDYYPADAPEEALQKFLGYIHENKMSASTFREILRKMARELIIFIIVNKRSDVQKYWTNSIIFVNVKGSVNHVRDKIRIL